jgi:hypothetical protein
MSSCKSVLYVHFNIVTLLCLWVANPLSIDSVLVGLGSHPATTPETCHKLTREPGVIPVTNVITLMDI